MNPEDTLCVDADGYCTDKCRQKVVNGVCGCLSRGPLWLPQPASEKQPNAPINLSGITGFENIATYAGTAVVPLPTPMEPERMTLGFASVHTRCDIRLREPAGTRQRGVTCHTCGAQANGTDAVECKG